MADRRPPNEQHILVLKGIIRSLKHRIATRDYEALFGEVMKTCECATLESFSDAGGRQTVLLTTVMDDTTNWVTTRYERPTLLDALRAAARQEEPKSVVVKPHDRIDVVEQGNDSGLQAPVPPEPDDLSPDITTTYGESFPLSPEL